MEEAGRALIVLIIIFGLALRSLAQKAGQVAKTEVGKQAAKKGGEVLLNWLFKKR